MAHLKFLHISDTHFRNNYEGSLDRWEIDYDPAAIFEEFLASYDYSDIDFVAHTGDLIHDGTKEDYYSLKKLMNKYIPEEIPIFCCLGNHDLKKDFYEGFFDINEDGLYCYQETINGYRLIFLDTSQEDKHDGVIDTTQEQWLFNILKEPSENGTLIFQHHPLEISWAHGLEKTQVSEDYIERLNQMDVIGLFTGHLHQNRHVMLGNIPQHTANSFVFGINRIDGQLWNTNCLGFSEVEINKQQLDVYTGIIQPKIEKFNSDII